MMDRVSFVVFILVVGYLAICDLIHRKIPLIPIIIYWVCGLLFRLVMVVNADACGKASLIRWLLVYPLLAGGMMGMQWFLRHAVGRGDAYVVLAANLWLGMRRIIEALLFSMGILLLGCIVSAFVTYCCGRRANRKRELPYIPVFWISVILTGW